MALIAFFVHSSLLLKSEDFIRLSRSRLALQADDKPPLPHKLFISTEVDDLGFRCNFQILPTKPSHCILCSFIYTPELEQVRFVGIKHSFQGNGDSKFIYLVQTGHTQWGRDCLLSTEEQDKKEERVKLVEVSWEMGIWAYLEHPSCCQISSFRLMAC